MKVKGILIALLLVQVIFAITFGPSEITLKKTWIIEGTPGDEFDLDGIFILNNSNQKILNIEKSPELILVYDNDKIKVRYKGTLDSGKKALFASAKVEINFNNSISTDYPLVIKPIPGEGYTEYNLAMENKAKQLSDQTSSLNTIRNLVTWVHSYIAYDISYFGNNVPAQTVYKDRRGVCVEYSHLLMALLKSLGYKARYVSGYVLAEDWQPHAWVEVETPEGWLPADPTYLQVQNLDNSHIAMYYAESQDQVFDSLSSYKRVKFSSKEEITPSLMQKLNSRTPVKIEYKFAEAEKVFTVTLENLEGKYKFYSYAISFPPEISAGEDTVILLAPNQKQIFTYSLESTSFKKGFTYNVPARIIVNDYEITHDLTIDGDGASTQTNSFLPASEKPKNVEICYGPSLLILFSSLSILLVKRGNNA